MEVKLSNGLLIKVTGEHPFLVKSLPLNPPPKGEGQSIAGYQWVLAKDLKAKDKLTTQSGSLFVESVEFIDKELEVYNFEVEDNHTYVAYGAVVHNDCVLRGGQLVWLKDGEASKAGDIVFGEKASKAIAFVQGSIEALTDDQIEAALQSAGGLACAGNLSNCALVLEHKDALVQEVKDRGLPQPKAGSDIKWYNIGQQAGHAGTVVIGIFETNAGKEIVAASITTGVATGIPTAGAGVAVSAGGVATGAAVAAHGANTAAVGLANLRNGSGGGSEGQLSPSESPIWKQAKPYRDTIKTNGLTGSERRYYKWDRTHGDIEMFDRTGKHLGSIDPITGNLIKPPVPGRKEPGIR